MKKDKVKQIVKRYYDKIALQGGGGNSCGGGVDASNEQIAKSIGYSGKEIRLAADANLGLGCGNPTGLGEIKKGEIVLDLGSGAGFDCFLAAKKESDTSLCR